MTVDLLRDFIEVDDRLLELRRRDELLPEHDTVMWNRLLSLVIHEIPNDFPVLKVKRIGRPYGKRNESQYERARRYAETALEV